MARRGDMTSLAERLTIRDRAADGATDAMIAHELGGTPTFVQPAAK